MTVCSILFLLDRFNYVSIRELYPIVHFSFVCFFSTIIFVIQEYLLDERYVLLFTFYFDCFIDVLLCCCCILFSQYPTLIHPVMSCLAIRLMASCNKLRVCCLTQNLVMHQVNTTSVVHNTSYSLH